MKQAFSLLELIFGIVILAIIASFAVPKFMDTKDSALISTLKNDIASTVNLVQSYYLLHQKLDKISDTIILNETNWNISDKKIEDKHSCITLGIVDKNGAKTFELLINQDKDRFCKKVRDSGLKSKVYNLS